MKDNNQGDALDFNLDVLTDGKSDAPSLSELYKIPVFTKEISESSVNLIKEHEQRMDEMEKEVFLKKDESGQYIETIKKQVFSNTILSKNKEYNEEQKQETSIYLFIFIIFICIVIVVLYYRKKSKERKKYIESINDFT
ncbi:hypothetical protein [Miniphocaeibacter massiliensis]|uniref:hypothetical protein n=1 Tax=Miniphocaeibacter massiliensis TaxID=2041841 RepID=UPI000C1C4411|nr:hypothetical protein [Miniphocaeibacter massiliensis]